MTFPILVISEVKQWCILPPVVFLIIVDEVMRKTTEEEKRGGINRGISEQLEDLDFADDICLLSHTFVDIKKKLRDLQNEE
jgi:hypothetical protein